MSTIGEMRSRVPRAALVGCALTLAVSVGLLWWAKWSPYLAKTTGLLRSHSWPGSDVLASAGAAGSAPSWSGGLAFAVAYGTAVWPALVAALVIAAALHALVPRAWLLRVLDGPGRLRPLRPALLAMPAMMCTCCTAPVAATLRRSGASTRSVLAFWTASPVLNPAVLVFLLLVAPWQWAATRLLVGLLLVLVVTGVVAAVQRRRTAPLAVPALTEQESPFALSSAPTRFARTLLRLSLTLVPEYVVVVLALGIFRGWLFPLTQTAHTGIGALGGLAVAVFAGTLVVIPTGGEIPIVQALGHAGADPGILGALLITLPAISLPSMVMLARALSWRVVALMALGVAACGVVAAALLAVLV